MYKKKNSGPKKRKETNNSICTGTLSMASIMFFVYKYMSVSFHLFWCFLLRFVSNSVQCVYVCYLWRLCYCLPIFLLNNMSELDDDKVNICIPLILLIRKEFNKSWFANSYVFDMFVGFFYLSHTLKHLLSMGIL